jgi:hypothetical protein
VFVLFLHLRSISLSSGLDAAVAVLLVKGEANSVINHISATNEDCAEKAAKKIQAKALRLSSVKPMSARFRTFSS